MKGWYWHNTLKQPVLVLRAAHKPGAGGEQGYQWATVMPDRGRGDQAWPVFGFSPMSELSGLAPNEAELDY